MKRFLWAILFILMISCVSALDINCSHSGSLHERFFPLRLVWDMGINTTYYLVVDGLNFTNATSPVQINFSINTTGIALSSYSGNVTGSCLGWVSGIKNTAPEKAKNIIVTRMGSVVNVSFSQQADADGENITNGINGSLNFDNIRSGFSFALPGFGNYSFSIWSRDNMSSNWSDIFAVNYTDESLSIVSFDGPRDVMPFTGRNISLIYYLNVSSPLSSSVSATLNGRACDANGRNGDIYFFYCYFGVTDDMYSLISFSVVATNSFSSKSASYSILRVGKLTSIRYSSPTFDFANIYNDWIMTLNPLWINNTGSVDFIGQDVTMGNNIVCNNIVFNASSIFFGRTANRGASEVFSFKTYDDVIRSKESADYFMFLYNPNKVTPNNCRAVFKLNVVSESD